VAWVYVWPRLWRRIVLPRLQRGQVSRDVALALERRARGHDERHAELGGAESRITIGDASVFTYDVLIQCGTTIDIGEHCMFGQSTIVIDGNHRFRDLDRPMLAQGYDFRPIHIDDDATITSKCTIIADVGRRAFVGANAVVTRPVPAYTVVGGVPARPLDYFGPEEASPSGVPEANSERSG